MKTPDKNKVYDLSELSCDKYNKVQELCQTYPKSRGKYFVYSFDRWVISVSGNFYTEIANAKELFTDQTPDVGKMVFNPQPHYDNSKGSLYKVATDRNWNTYLFDIVKRLERGGKKDPLEQEIKKSIDLLNLWLIEHGTSNN